MDVLHLRKQESLRFQLKTINSMSLGVCLSRVEKGKKGQQSRAAPIVKSAVARQKGKPSPN